MSVPYFPQILPANTVVGRLASAGATEAVPLANLAAAVLAILAGEVVPGPGAPTTFTFSASTGDADPGDGIMRLNNAAPASATFAYLDDENSGAVDLTDWYAVFAAGGYLTIYDRTTPTTKFAIYSVDAAITDATGYVKVPITYVDGGGTFDADAEIVVSYLPPGQTGATAPNGGAVYTFSTTTTDADPGSGIMRFNNAALASVTEAYLDNNNAGGNDISDYLDYFDDAGDATQRGVVLFYDNAAPDENFAYFAVTGSVTDGTGYRKLALTHINSAGTFANGAELSVVFQPRGPAGAGVAGPVSSTDNAVARWDGTGGSTLQNSTEVTIDDTSNLFVGAADRASQVLISLRAAAGQLRRFIWRTGDVFRWTLVVDGTAEGGSNAGSDWSLVAYNDAGSAIHTAISVVRSTGYTTFIQAYEGTKRLLSVAGGLTLEGGFAGTSQNLGTITSGTVTPVFTTNNIYRYVNNGAHTLAPPTGEGTMVIDILNAASAGAITTSGFTKVTGSFTTTNTDRFRCYIDVINSVSHLNIVKIVG
jgi:hypothetical protein